MVVRRAYTVENHWWIYHVILQVTQKTNGHIRLAKILFQRKKNHTF